MKYYVDSNSREQRLFTSDASEAERSWLKTHPAAVLVMPESQFLSGQSAEIAKRMVLAERERCLSIAADALKRAAGFTDKEFADGYSFAAQEIAGKIRGEA